MALVDPTVLNLASLKDARIANIVALGTGEGFSTFTGTFGGRPALFIDCGTVNAVLDEEDRVTSPVTVYIFDGQTERNAYIENMRRTRPDVLGVGTVGRQAGSER